MFHPSDIVVTFVYNIYCDYRERRIDLLAIKIFSKVPLKSHFMSESWSYWKNEHSFEYWIMETISSDFRADVREFGLAKKFLKRFVSLSD